MAVPVSTVNVLVIAVPETEKPLPTERANTNARFDAPFAKVKVPETLLMPT